MKMKQGLGEANMIGQSVFSKYYSAKMKLVFPSEKPIGDHFKAQIIWGWMTAPFNLKARDHCDNCEEQQHRHR